MNRQMDLNIREAILDDLPTLKAFEQEIIRYERPFAPNLKKDPISYYDIKGLIQRDDAHVLVATDRNRIIASGYALVKNSKPYFQPGQYAYLGFMFVAPDYRGQGINGTINQNLITWAKKRGLSEIQLEVYASNDSAIRAYLKMGFQPDILKMRLNTEEIESKGQ